MWVVKVCASLSPSWLFFLFVGLGSSLTPALPQGQWLTNVSECGATWSRTVLVDEAVGTLAMSTVMYCRSWFASQGWS